jgi:hypothetical protein
MENITTAEHFLKYGWAYVPDLISKSECKMLSDYLFLLKKENKTKNGDYQCPLSDAVYGEKYLDIVLESLCPKISKMTGISLLPTYSYSRIYRTGEELLIHKDRESCEISATITLGHDINSGIWPIYFSATDELTDIHRQIIEIGSAVIYRGMDMWHWRQKYRGKWQTQIFTHYVDANGSNSNFAYDKRAKLGS